MQTAPDQTDYAAWPIKELRRFLIERGESAAGITEKAELVSKVQQLAAQVGFCWLLPISCTVLQPHNQLSFHTMHCLSPQSS